MSESRHSEGRGPALPGSLRSDERLARRAGAGDARAFAAIYRRYGQGLYRYCLSLLGEDADAQDALQNTMVKALRALPGEERRIKLKPWLYRVAHNESIELLRGRREEELDSEAASPAAGPAETVEARQRLQRLLADVAELPERQRGALAMRELSGLDFGEIGAALGMSAAAARQAVYEARLGLREMEAGHEMVCATVTRALSDGDRRTLRRRDVRAHLRTCAECRAFGAAIAERRHDFAAISPLPAAAAAAVLQGALGGAGAGGAAAGASAGGAAGAGGTAVSGGSLTAGAGGAAVSGGGLALKGIAVVAVAAALGGGAAERAGLIHFSGSGERGGASDSAAGGSAGGAGNGVMGAGPSGAGHIRSSRAAARVTTQRPGQTARAVRPEAANGAGSTADSPTAGQGGAIRGKSHLAPGEDKGRSGTAPGRIKAKGLSTSNQGRGGGHGPPTASGRHPSHGQAVHGKGAASKGHGGARGTPGASGSGSGNAGGAAGKGDAGAERPPQGPEGPSDGAGKSPSGSSGGAGAVPPSGGESGQSSEVVPDAGAPPPLKVHEKQ